MPRRTENAKTSIKIPSATAGWNLDAWVYLPTNIVNPGPNPVIVMAHGLGCNKLLGLASYAEAFVAVGYACVVFDYRRWGASDGTHRNSVFVAEQLEDYRTVIKYCRSQPEYDSHRIILWGYSFSGGHVLTLSAEPDLHILATISQSPFVGRSFVSGFNYLFLKRCSLAAIDFLRQLLGFSPLYIPAVAHPGQVGAMTAPGTVEALNSICSNPSDFPNQISASIFFRSPLYSPRETAAFISCPVLFIVPMNDLICSHQAMLDVSTIVTNSEVERVTGGHFDMFPGNVDHEASLKSQIAFLGSPGCVIVPMKKPDLLPTSHT